MSEYTRIPWKIERNLRWAGLYDVYDKDGNRLLEAKVSEVAHLMGASPELLAACVLTRDLIEELRGGAPSTIDFDRLYEIVIAAIAKATGELTYDRAMDELGFGEE